MKLIMFVGATVSQTDHGHDLSPLCWFAGGR